MSKKFAALLSGAVATGAVMASTPVFAAQSLSQGYQVAAAAQKAPEGACGGNAKSQEGSCGANANANAKSQEGSCGSNNAKAKEGSCGAKKGNKPAKTEKPAKASKGMEGRCGEGKCGGNRKMK